MVDKKYLEISHGLGITPDMVIVQLRHGSTNWVSDIMGKCFSDLFLQCVVSIINEILSITNLINRIKLD